MMKKHVFAILMVLLLSGALISGCSGKTEVNEVKVPVTETPSAVSNEEVNEATPDLLEETDEVEIGEVI